MGVRSGWVGLMLLAGCACGPEGRCLTRQLFGDGYFIVGEEARVPVGLELNCTSNDVAPRLSLIEVEVEVLDPDNRRVSSVTNSGATRSGTGTLVTIGTEVRFTPDRPGAWTVVVRFEPGLGRSQQQYRTLVAPRGAPVRTLATSLPTDCTFYGLTSRDVPLCVRRTSAGAMELAVGAQRFGGTGFAVDGEALWRVTAASLERLAPDDAGVWSATHTTAIEGSPNATVVAAEGEVLFVRGLGAGSLHRVAAQPDGGIWAEAIDLGVERIAIMASPTPDGLLALTWDGAAGVFTRGVDGGTAIAHFANGLPMPLAAGEGQLWVGPPALVDDASGGTNQVMGVAWEAGVVRREALPIRELRGQMVSPLSPQVPVVQAPTGKTEWRMAVPAWASSGLVLEVYEPLPGFTEVVSATRRHAFARSADGGWLAVIAR